MEELKTAGIRKKQYLVGDGGFIVQFARSVGRARLAFLREERERVEPRLHVQSGVFDLPAIAFSGAATASKENCANAQYSLTAALPSSVEVSVWRRRLRMKSSSVGCMNAKPGMRDRAAERGDRMTGIVHSQRGQRWGRNKIFIGFPFRNASAPGGFGCWLRWKAAGFSSPQQ